MQQHLKTFSYWKGYYVEDYKAEYTPSIEKFKCYECRSFKRYLPKYFIILLNLYITSVSFEKTHE